MAANKGDIAEKMARIFLRLKGWRIIAKNYKTGRGTHAGEIDIIARRGKTIIFVEVKKRSTIDAAAYAILAKQRQRIKKGAEAFLQRHPQYQNHTCRFDAILIKLPLTLVHLKNAF